MSWNNRAGVLNKYHYYILKNTLGWKGRGVGGCHLLEEILLNIAILCMKLVKDIYALFWWLNNASCNLRTKIVYWFLENIIVSLEIWLSVPEILFLKYRRKSVCENSSQGFHDNCQETVLRLFLENGSSEPQHSKPWDNFHILCLYSLIIIQDDIYKKNLFKDFHYRR